MSDFVAGITRAVLAANTQVSSHMSTAAQEGRQEEIQALLDKRYEEEQRIIDETNRRGLSEQKRVYAQRQAVNYRLSVAQMVDARLQAREYELLSQDFLAKAQYKRGQMSVAYARSGALMGGSALLRVKQNKDRAAQGADRFKRAATYALERGKMLSTITKHSSVKPQFVPIPDAIRQTHIEMPMPDINRSGGGGGGGYGMRGGAGGGGAVSWARPVVDDQGVRTGNPATFAFQKGGVFQKGYPMFSGFYEGFGQDGGVAQPNWAAGQLTPEQRAMEP